MPDPLMLSARDAFRRLGVGRDTGYALIRHGRLRAVRIGERRVLIPATELDAFISRELAKDVALDTAREPT